MSQTIRSPGEGVLPAGSDLPERWPQDQTSVTAPKPLREEAWWRYGRELTRRLEHARSVMRWGKLRQALINLAVFGLPENIFAADLPSLQQIVPDRVTSRTRDQNLVAKRL